MALNGWGSKKKREKPNILITGTPGTGKTTTATALAESIQLRHINIGDLVKEKNLHDGWDDQFDCYLINEDLVSLLIKLVILVFDNVVIDEIGSSVSSVCSQERVSRYRVVYLLNNLYVKIDDLLDK